jgi:hypothetical protein
MQLRSTRARRDRGKQQELEAAQQAPDSTIADVLAVVLLKLPPECLVSLGSCSAHLRQQVSIVWYAALRGSLCWLAAVSRRCHLCGA